MPETDDWGGVAVGQPTTPETDDWGGVAVAKAPSEKDDWGGIPVPQEKDDWGGVPVAANAPTSQSGYDPTADKFTDPAVQSRFTELAQKRFSGTLNPDESKELRGMVAKVPTGLEGTLLDPANASLGDPTLTARLGAGNVDSGFSTGSVNLGAIPNHLLSTIVDNLNTATGSEEDANKDPEIQQLRQEGDAPVVITPKPTADNFGAKFTSKILSGADSLTTAKNLELMGVGAVGPKIIGRAIGGAFAAEGVKNAPEILNRLYSAKTPGEAGEAAGDLANTLLMVFAGATHLLSGEAVPHGERPPSMSPAEADRAAVQNQLRAMVPEIPLTKEGMPIHPQDLDGLTTLRAALADRAKEPGEDPKAIQPFIDHVDDILLKVDKDAAQASEARVAQQRAQQPIPAEEAVPENTGGPQEKPNLFQQMRQAQQEAGVTPEEPPVEGNASEVPTTASETPPIADPAMHQAALDSAERIATQVTSGQGDIVQRAARDAAFDKIQKNIAAGKPTMSFVRETAKEAAGKAVEKAGPSLDVENDQGKTLGESTPSEELTPVQQAAKTDMIDAVQKQVETLPTDIQKTAKAFLEAAQNGDKTDLRSLGEKLGVSQTTVANHLTKMRAAFKGLKEEGYSVGPGAASISEQLGESLSSIKNTSTEAGRAAAGLPERDAVGRQTFGDIWDNALKSFDEDPQVGKKLVDELGTKSRPLTDKEDAILTHELADRQQSYDEALHQVSEARTAEEHAAAKEQLDRARSALHEVYDASEKAGTENARGLSARRLMVKSDYSLVGVERKLRDNLGRDISDEERAKVEKPVEAAEKADEKAKAAEEEYTKAKEDEETQHFVEATINELGKSYLEKPAYGKKVFDIARGIVDRWKEEAKTAHSDLRKALGAANAGIPNPAIVLHVAKILRAKIGEFGLDKTEAFADMVSEYGPKVKEHLEAGWKKAHALIAGEKGDSKAKEVAGKGLGKKGEKTPVEAKAEAKAEKVAGDKLSQKTITDHVRALINAGEHDTNALMSKTTEALKEHFPHLTERDVRRAFVDYGKKIFPSKEAVEVEIRENKQIVKLQEDINREMEGQKGIVDPETGQLMGAEKQGYQRDKATQRVRDLIKQRNELLKKRQGPDSPEKLASTQAARKTTLENAIADTNRELKTGEKRAQTEAAPDDAHNEQLRAELQAMRNKVKEIDAEKNPGKSEAQKQEESLQRQLDAANAELAGTKEKSQPKEWKALSQKAEDLRAQLDSVRQLKKELETKPERTLEDISAEKAQKGVDAAAAAVDRWDRILKGEIDREPGKAREPQSQLEEDLRSEADTMRKTADEIRRNSAPKGDKDAAILKSLEKSIADYERRVRDSDFSTKADTPVARSVAVQKARELRDAAKKVYDDLKKAQKPVKTPDERYNETRLKQIQKDIAEKQAYLDNLKKTGVVPPKTSPAVKAKFAATAKAEAELTAKKREVDDAVRKIVYDNRSTPAKIKEAALTALKLVTSVKVLGHGTVGMFTHAGGLAWRPTVAKIFWTNFGKQFKLWTNKAFHEQAVYKLKNDPDFQTWKDAGASIDPEQTYTDYGLYAKWFGKLGEAGGRGFDALKLTRLELNKATWDKVPDSIKNDPVAAAETRKAIADINNKATGAIPKVSPVTPEGSPNRITNGVYNLAKNPLADAAFFAPKLYASRWARVVLDPVKTVGTLADWKNASAADKAAAKIRMKNAGQFAAVYVSALLVNQGLLKASGSNQEVNIANPTKPDWLKFKGAGKEVVADGGLLDPLRLLGQVIVGDILNVRTKNQQYREGTRYQKITEDLGRYARSKFNPTLGLAVDATTGTDYAGKPLPWSNEPPKYKDQGKYTWGEWLLQQGPIPVGQGTKVAYDEMRKNGMSHAQAMHILEGAAVAALGTTGVHVADDHSQNRTPATESRKIPKRR